MPEETLGRATSAASAVARTAVPARMRPPGSVSDIRRRDRYPHRAVRSSNCSLASSHSAASSVAPRWLGTVDARRHAEKV